MKSIFTWIAPSSILGAMSQNRVFGGAMKTLAGLAFVACMFATHASGTPAYAVGQCDTSGGVFGFNNPNPNTPPLTGTWFCPTAASLGASGVMAEFLLYDSDYSSGLVTPVTETTIFTFTSPTTILQYSSDTETTTGASL